MSGNNVLKFLHFNSQYNQKTFSKRMFHVWQNRTVAALALSPHAIKQAAQDFLNLAADEQLYIRTTVGVAFVSRDDNYDRKVGRDEAVKKMTDINLEIISINANATHVYLNMAPHQGVALTYRLNKRTGFSSVLGQITGKAEDRVR